MGHPQRRGSGHGHVFPNPDGSRAKCGGPSVCLACAEDLRALETARKLGQEGLAAQYTEPYSVAANLLELMKGQLLIVMTNRLGGEVEIPVAEVDGAGAWMLSMEVDQVRQVFKFKASKKQ